MEAIIFRGCSGSGKSTYIANRFPNAFIVSADAYLAEKNINRKDGLHEAHKASVRRFVEALIYSAPQIVVDNTNTTPYEVGVYVQVAQAYNYQVRVIRIYCDPLIAWQRNVHNVPLGIVLHHHQNLMNLSLPGFVREEVICVNGE